MAFDSSESFTKDLKRQVRFLSNGIFGDEGLPYFDKKLVSCGLQRLRPDALEVFQVNIGYMCNQTCKHCHVDAGPNRTEIMNRETMDLCLEKIREFDIKSIDITGGAPEMNPNFRYFIEELRKINTREIIVRSNLTIVLANPKYHDLPDFFKNNKLRVVSSLPFYHASKTDRQRGEGVFNKSIKALNMLNEVGYGKGDLILDLVYNPSGAFLPGNQHEMEKDFKKALFEDHGIVFNKLLSLTNLPINRFLDYLVASGNYEEYMNKLIESFNTAAISGLMCRNTISVDYQGRVFDCDFNQMLGLAINTKNGDMLSDLNLKILNDRNIETGQHCYGCTAGAGSSCQGTLV
jgi:radical SAM/Cys-rich protein